MFDRALRTVMRIRLFSRRIVVLVGVCALLFPAIGGCGSSNNSSSTVPEASPRSSATANGQNSATAVTPGSAEAELGAALDRLGRFKSYRATMTAEINGQHQTLETIDFVPPDSYHVVAGDDTELIVIGQDYYLKANGSWRKGPAGTQSPSDPAKVISSSAEIAGKVVKGGIGFTSEGERCQLYTYSGKDQSAPVTHVCVSDASVPYQWTTVIGGYNTVIKLSDFDADITITAPSLGP